MATVRTRHGGDAFRALFHAAPAGVALCTAQGHFCEVNEAARAILSGTGVDPESATLHDLLRHTPQDSIDYIEWIEALARLQAGEHEVARARLNLSAPGTPPSSVRVTATPVAFADGRPYLLVHLEDATGRRHAGQRVVYLATQDSLTGLANRELVQQRLVAALARAEVSELPVGVLSIDLNGFDQMSARYGAAAAETVLATVGARLAKVLRAGDVAGRCDADRFVIVASDVAGEAALAELVKRIEATLALPVQCGAATGTGEALAGMTLAYSMGAVLSRPAEQAGPLLRRADAARYAVRRRRHPSVGAPARADLRKDLR